MVLIEFEVDTKSIPNKQSYKLFFKLLKVTSFKYYIITLYNEIKKVLENICNNSLDIFGGILFQVH